MKKKTVFVMSITPFDDAGKLDESALRAHLRRLREAGVSTYVASSASGEGFALTPEEHERILGIAMEEMRGAVRAMGCEPRDTEQTLAFLRRCEPFKLDAVHVLSPEMGHGAKPSIAELERYYLAALNSTETPVVISSFLNFGYQLPLDLVERLADRFSHLRGYVYAGPDTAYLTQVITRLGDRLEVHCGGPANAPLTLSLGGTGFMGVDGNFSPVLVASVLAAFEKGDVAALRTLYRKLMLFNHIHLRHGLAAGRSMKPLLNAYGLPGGTLRPPRLPIGEDDLREVIQATMELDLPGVPKRPIASS